ncbi:MAG: hypothetical protein ACYS5F_13555 [Planctomycetota bacterium]|jgi:hypothetical protein
MAKKEKEVAKKKAAPKAPKAPKGHVVVTVDKVLIDQPTRASVLIQMKDGTEAWIPRELIKSKSGKKFTIPQYLKEIKKI